ncbi:MAG: hypothetical protein KAS66_10675 [Candidatus Omnitrophica bacterium]|nr:hypothetical protein [Candidatus Omnitrophota bacterium]
MEENVIRFVNECAKRLSESQSWDFMSELEMFSQEGYGMWGEGIESPIEQILFAAILHNIKINGIPLAGPNAIGMLDVVFGVDIAPQFKIGRYRVDFKITMVKTIFSNKEKRVVIDDSKSVVVECDSQQWHERTEKERRYEKAKDRYFAKHNLKTFHYTGAEIIKNPHKIAAEILQEFLVIIVRYKYV